VVDMKNTGIGFGYGKTILFGEHFVVYGLPGIVAALDDKFAIRIKKSQKKKHTLIDHSPKFKTAYPQKFTFDTNQSGAMLSAVIDHFKIKDHFKITLEGTLKIANSGMGSSAASCVALARAIDDLYGLNLSDAKINEAAYAGEIVMHGKPSGIDNTAATYGGTFLFEPDKITTIKIKTPLHIVLAESGIKTKTKEVVTDVKRLKETNPNLVEKLFANYKKIVTQAQVALEDNSHEQVGVLMNRNHDLLVQLGVSHSELNKMVEVSRKTGALGAKLTGTGRGGLMVALAPDKEIQKKIAEKLEASGYETLATSIGVDQ
jgi:mevalonate kinase